MTEFSIELVNVSKVFDGERKVDANVVAVQQVNLRIRCGEFFTLLGPSGCGKTTTLRLIGGFETPTNGEIYIQGKPVKHAPPYRRPVNVVFQNYALFPHLTVAQNIAFGLTVKRIPKNEQERRVKDMLELVRLPEVGQRKPAQLSGGQQQRVALARALINQPAVLLLDEPLGALDLKLRKQMQIELKHLQQQIGITFVYVTHDQEEALTMSDRIAVMAGGKVLQVDRPVTIYEKPATRFVADFIGESNFIQGTVAALENGQIQVAVGPDRVYALADKDQFAPGQPVILTIRPEKLRLYRPEEANGIALTGVVREAVYIGTDTRFIVDLPSGESIVARLQNVNGSMLDKFAVGAPVKVTWAGENARALVN
ncbi:MAG: ABC transporter ATP-binding protein [Anaerolineae bacterium]|nr:ABC transporter ATP-binding protein [Anaerolineae bacterium]